MDEFINEISGLIKPLSYKAKVLFGALTSEKLYPNYIFFQEQAGWGNGQLLQDAMSLIYQYAIDDALIPFEEIQDAITRIELITPDTEDFEDVSASFALDACTSLFSTLKYIISRDDNDILDLATYALDTVYAFIQYKEQFNPFDPSCEIQTEHDEFMINEKQRQRQLLVKLSEIDLNLITDDLINSLRNKYPVIDLSLLSE